MLIDLLEARSLLPQLIERALAGEEVVILRAGRPVVRLVPFDGAAPSESEDEQSEIAEFFADALGG